MSKSKSQNPKELKTEPRPGLCIELSKIDRIRIRDGDTIEFYITRMLPVRVDDIDCPENDDPRSIEINEFVNNLLLQSDKTKIFISSGKSIIKLTDITSFDRVKGEIWIDGKNLSDILKDKGYEK